LIFDKEKIPAMSPFGILKSIHPILECSGSDEVNIQGVLTVSFHSTLQDYSLVEKF